MHTVAAVWDQSAAETRKRAVFGGIEQQPLLEKPVQIAGGYHHLSHVAGEIDQRKLRALLCIPRQHCA